MTRQNALNTLIMLLQITKVSILEPVIQTHGNALNTLSNSVTNSELAKTPKSLISLVELDLLVKLLMRKDSKTSMASISARKCLKLQKAKVFTGHSTK